MLTQSVRHLDRTLVTDCPLDEPFLFYLLQTLRRCLSGDSVHPRFEFAEPEWRRVEQVVNCLGVE